MHGSEKWMEGGRSGGFRVVGFVDGGLDGGGGEEGGIPRAEQIKVKAKDG